MHKVEDQIVPVVRAFEKEPGIWGVKFHGTGFFVDDRGAFLTASHVMANAEADFVENGGFIGLIVGHPSDPERRSIAQIAAFEPAPEPNDVAIGRAVLDGKELATKGAFAWPGDDQGDLMWQAVWTAGYPRSAVTAGDGDQHLPPRGYHGYVMRHIRCGHVLVFPHPDLFEVDFPMVRGMSGSPLFLRGADPQSLILVGICRGSHTSEVVDYVEETLQSEGPRYVERRLRTEHHGLADDIRSLADWQPHVLQGSPLGEFLRKA